MVPGTSQQEGCVCCSLKQPLHTGRASPLLPSCSVWALLSGGGEQLLVQMIACAALAGVAAGAES